MLPDQGQHVVLYTGGGFTPGAKVIIFDLIVLLVTVNRTLMFNMMV